MDCRQIYFSLSQSGAITTDRYTMVDQYGNYVFYDILGSTLVSGLTYSTGASVSNFTLTSFTQSGNWSDCGIINDVDANAFIIAANITDSTQKSAIYRLVSDLKVTSIWNKFKAIYPMVGGSSFSCKWNLKDPRDLDAAFRLGLSGSATFSSTGAAFASSGFAHTYLVPSTSLSQDDTHISYYSRSNTTGSGGGFDCSMGVNSAGVQIYTSSLSMFLRYSNDAFIADHYSFPSSRISVSSNLDSSGYYISTRVSSNDFRTYRNNTQIGSNIGAAGSIPNKEIFLGALNDFDNGFGTWLTNRECAFATIGDGLNPTQSSSLYTAVNTFQTTLGRNV